MRLRSIVVAMLLSACSASAQMNFDTWIYNLDGTTTGHYSATGASGDLKANISKLQYDSTYVYVSAYGVPAYTMTLPESRYPGEQTYLFKIKRTATENTGTKQTVLAGVEAFLVNGVPVYNPGDGQSYSSSLGQDSGSGDGVWNRNAVPAESSSYDTCFGHTSGNNPGRYHHHQRPKCLLSYFGDTSSAHSPLIGWSFDGVPIYGPYGYSTALDNASGVRRMVSGYAVRADLPVGAARTNGPTVTSSGNYRQGWYLEDFEYVGGGDLDLYNGRFCVTPEYPSGTYAYFTTIDGSGNSAYPYVIGPKYWGTLAIGYASTTVTVPGGATEYQPSCPVTVTPSQSSAAPSTSMTASVPDAGTGGSYSWQITNGSITGGSSTRTVTFTTSPSGLTTTVTATVRQPRGCKASGSGNVTASSLSTPTNFAAALTSTTSASLSWTATSGASQYVIYRRTPSSGGWAEIGTSATTNFTNSSLSASSAYIYAVQAANSDRSIVSSQSLPDYVTTYGYTDNPPTATSTIVKAQHITELRSALLALYQAISMTSPTFTDSSLTAGMTIRTAHVSELRTAVNTFRTSLLLSSLIFTDSTLTATSTAVKKLHLTELRVGLKGYCSPTTCQ